MNAMRNVMVLAAALLLAAPPAFAESYRLLSGAVICKSKKGLTRWLDAVAKDDEPARKTILESRECAYTFRKQLVEAVELRMFYKFAVVLIDGKEWVTQKSNLRVPAPEPGERER